MPNRLSDLVPDQPSGSDHALLNAALTLYETWPIKTDEELDKLVLKILVRVFKTLNLADRIDEAFSDDFINLSQAMINTILEENEFCWKIPPDIIKVKYLNAAAKLDPERLKIATEKLTDLFTILFRDFFPSTVLLLKEDETSSNDPDYFIDHIREPQNLIANVYDLFLHLKHNDQPLFPQLYRQITDNVLLANGYTEETYKSGKQLKGALELKAPPVELARLFLKETTFDVLFCLPIFVPEPQMPQITDDILFEHTFVLAASGGGKTTKLYHDVLERIDRADPPAQIIIDPKGTVVKELTRLACFDPHTGKHRDRLIIIDPSDFAGPPSFNIFKPSNQARFDSYHPLTREALESQIIELLAYAFSSRNQKLTAKQGPCFEQVCRMMLRLPNPSLITLFQILKDQQSERKPSFASMPPEWKNAVATLDPQTQLFFEHDYYTNYSSTRDEIVARLYGVVSKPIIGRVFGAEANTFDMFDALQMGKLVIINVPLTFLQADGAELFGKYMIAYTFAAALERLTLPKTQWRPAFLYIDEFQLFADDEKTPSLLGVIREFNVGVTMFTQMLANFSEKIRSVCLTNTRSRYAARLKTDASIMAKAMGNCDPQLLNCAPNATHVRFASYVDGLTDEPIIVQYPRGAITRQPQMSEESHQVLLARNRERVSRPQHPTAVPRPSSSLPPTPAMPPPPPSAKPSPQPRTDEADSW